MTRPLCFISLVLVPLVLSFSLGQAFLNSLKPSSSNINKVSLCHASSTMVRRPSLLQGSDGPSSSSTFLETDEDLPMSPGEEVDEVLDDAFNQPMQSVAVDWDKEGPASKSLRRYTSTSSSSSSSSLPSIAEYEAMIEPPPSHEVYYRGSHERSFWRQGRDIIQLCIPVPQETPKYHVQFRMDSKTHIYLALGEVEEEKDVIFDRELAQPVYIESSFWYFEQDGGETRRKMIVIELDKRLDYSNWPRLFPEDPDVSQKNAAQE